MRNTIRKVTMVVLVLMTSCQVSEKPNIGPVTAQARIMASATMKAHGEPTASATACEALRKNSFVIPTSLSPSQRWIGACSVSGKKGTIEVTGGYCRVNRRHDAGIGSRRMAGCPEVER